MRNATMWIVGAVLLSVAITRAAVPVVTNVVALQGVGSNGVAVVYIRYDVYDDDGDMLKIRVEVSDDGGAHYSVPAFSFVGDIGEGVTTGAYKFIEWDAGKDWNGEYSEEMRVKVIAVDAKGLPGLAWGNEIAPGGFLMGQDGGPEGSGPSRHVNIPWSYWLSKYEIRNDQYCEYLNTALVAAEVYRYGTSGVLAHGGKYEGVPAGSHLITVSSSRDIRWNVNNFEVCDGRTNFPVRVTWYGAVAFAQHYGYDLPTDAEWEKAARGPEHDDEDEHQIYPWGNSVEGGNANYYNSGDPWSYSGDTYQGYRNTTPAGYYDGNQTPFGPDMVNAHGLYDVIGNLFEWTRSALIDTEEYQQEESLAADNNQLSNSSDRRVIRGGSWNRSYTDTSLKCCGRISEYVDMDRYSSYPDIGFRVIRRDAL